MTMSLITIVPKFLTRSLGAVERQQEFYVVFAQTRPTSRNDIILAVWNDDHFGRDNRNINHLVWRIRDKIELDSGEPQFLKTVTGRGYSIDVKITA